jgi:hypothetical protein
MSTKCRQNKRRGVFSRLATVRQRAPFTLPLLLGLVAAIGLASCGGGEDAKLLPGATAQEITENLDRVKQLASEGECVGAADAAQEVGAQVEGLSGVDAKLKQALHQGTERLDEVVATCDETITETVAPATEATTTEEEEKVPPGHEKHKMPPGQEKKEEKEEAPKETAPPPATPTPPSETPPATTPPDEESGGTGAPGGVGPGSPAEGGD